MPSKPIICFEDVSGASWLEAKCEDPCIRPDDLFSQASWLLSTKHNAKPGRLMNCRCQCILPPSAVRSARALPSPGV
jgi:hypothetical protein